MPLYSHRMLAIDIKYSHCMFSINGEKTEQLTYRWQIFGLIYLQSKLNFISYHFCLSSVIQIPWIRGPRDKKPQLPQNEQKRGTYGRMKSKPRSDDLSPSHQSGTCSWSTQSQKTLWPHHTSKQQIWKHRNYRSWSVIEGMEIIYFNNKIIK